LINNITSQSIPVSSKPKLDAVSFGIWLIGSAFGATWRPKIEVPDDISPLNAKKGNIYVLWHSTLLPLAYTFRKSKCTVMVSSSSDGQRAAAVAAKWNYEIVSGSSTRQGFSAFRQCLRVLKSNKNMVITPDGPRGPREIVKDGVAYLASLTHAPVIPLSVHPSKYWRLKSWDHMIIPKPFAKLVIRNGIIIYPDQSEKNEAAIEHLRIRIEESLHAITLA